MKIEAKFAFLVALVVKTLFPMAAFAQPNFSLSPGELVNLQCDLSKAYKGSAGMEKAFGAPVNVIHCATANKVYEVSFLGVKFPALSSTAMTLRCGANDPSGVYYFGGFPVGFQTSSYKAEPFFYNPKAARCSMVGNAALKDLQAVQNQSAMVILAVGAAPAI